MAEPTRPNTGDDTDVGPDRRSTPGRRRWVKVAVIIVLALVLLLVVLSRTGEHSGGGSDHDSDEGATEEPGEAPQGFRL